MEAQQRQSALSEGAQEFSAPSLAESLGTLHQGMHWQSPTGYFAERFSKT